MVTKMVTKPQFLVTKKKVLVTPVTILVTLSSPDGEKSHNA